jgi:hypothetical protein
VHRLALLPNGRKLRSLSFDLLLHVVELALQDDKLKRSFRKALLLHSLHKELLLHSLHKALLLRRRRYQAVLQ